jgi:hypothetical protein
MVARYRSDQATPCPFSVARRARLRVAAILTCAIILLANGIIWVALATLSASYPGLDPGQEITRSLAFAIFGTSLSVIIVRAVLRKPVTPLMVIAALAMWMLTPATVLFVFLFGRFWGSVGVLITMAPLLLVAVSLVLVIRGFLVRGTVALILPLLVVAGISFWLPEPPRPAAWLFVPWWHVALAAAALAAPAWQARRGHGSQRASIRGGGPGRMGLG